MDKELTDAEQWERFNEIARRYQANINAWAAFVTHFSIVYDMDLREIFKRVN